MSIASTLRATLFAFTAVASVASAHAQNRPSTTDMTCAQAVATVARAGGIVLRTGTHSYDRFVRDHSFCTPDEITIPTWAPTRDNPACMVGDRCESRAGRAPTPQ